MLTVFLAGLLLAAACAKATLTPTPTPPTVVTPTPRLAPPTPTLSPAEKTYREVRQNFETVVKPAALKEGVLTWYTCHSAESAKDEVGAFNKLYPGIKVEYVYESPGPLIERVKAEAKAGKVVADVYNCGGTSGYILGWDGFAVEHIVPTAIDPSIPWEGAMPPADPSQLWTQFSYNLGTVLINTDLVPKEHYPKSWWDFINNPWWTGKIAMGNPFAPGFTGNWNYLWLHDPTLGEPFIKALSDKKPKIFKTGGIDALARGEIPVFIAGGSSTPYIPPWKGAPIKDVYVKEGFYITNFHHTLIKGAPHLNAGQVFIDAFLSKEMQEVTSRWGRTPIRGDVTLAIPELNVEDKPNPFWTTPEKEKEIRFIYKWVDEKGYFK